MKSQGLHQSDGLITQLISWIDECYDRKAWHGPNLRGSIRGLTATRAVWRPAQGRHSIAEHILHCAYWKYTVRRRLRGDSRGSFPIKGSNWFPVPESLSDETWKNHIALLDGEHRTLREVILKVDQKSLHKVAAGGKSTILSLIMGIASHDVYHAGQIQLLKRLQSEPRE